MAASITDSQSTVESPDTIDEMTGIERAKELLEHAICKMKDLFVHLFKMEEKKNGFAAMNVNMVMVLISISSLSLCYLALDEEDDFDEEESDPDSDELCEGPLHDENIEGEDPETGSTSDSLCSTLATSRMRSRLESNRDLEDDSDEEESDVDPDDSCTAATEDEYLESEGDDEPVEQEEQKQNCQNRHAGETDSGTGSKFDSLSSVGARSKRKRCRDEEPCLVTKSTGKCRRT